MMRQVRRHCSAICNLLRELSALFVTNIYKQFASVSAGFGFKLKPAKPKCRFQWFHLRFRFQSGS